MGKNEDKNIDIGNQLNVESFNDLNMWLNIVKEINSDKIVLGVAANKADLYKEAKVTDEEGRKYAKEIGAEWRSTSSLLDDSGIAINTQNGIIVIAGCSHSGICNIVEYAKEVTGNNQVLAVLGGFHLRELGEDTNKAIEYMRKNVREVILAHCTVDEVCDKFIEELSEDIKISVTEVGKEYSYNNM